jgi:hypothetical protein
MIGDDTVCFPRNKITFVIPLRSDECNSAPNIVEVKIAIMMTPTPKN